MALTLEQKDRIRDWLHESDIAFLVEWIMDNTYDSRLEDLAYHIGAQEAEEDEEEEEDFEQGEKA